MTDQIEIPVRKTVTGSVKVPGSKSITNRAIILAALADGPSILSNALESVDTIVAKDSLRKLGINIASTYDQITVHGCGGQINECANPLWVENAGTAARFLVPILCAGKGQYKLDGSTRMRERPIGELIATLHSMGCDVKSDLNNDCLPLTVSGGRFPGGEVYLEGRTSSQFISALMIAAPLGNQPLIIQLGEKPVSVTYIEMTLDVMKSFGLQGEFNGRTITIPAPQRVIATNYEIESDVSSASYFFAAAAVTGGNVKVQHLRKNSIQGDIKLLEVLEKMGCEVNYLADGIQVKGNQLKGVEVNMNTFSDMVPTIACVALFAEGVTRIHDVANIRLKECDRLAAMKTELSKLGGTVTEFEDGLEIVGGSAGNTGAEIDTYDDHRIAMAFSISGLKIPNVKINDPDCVSKTFPDYFDRFFDLLNQSE